MRQNNLEDAFKVLQEAARGIGYFHLADTQGKMFGIESNFDEFDVVIPKKNLLFHTNCYCTERYKADDIAPAFLPDSFVRRDRMHQLLEGIYGNITPEIMMEVLSDHLASPTGICRHIDDTKPQAGQLVTLASYIMVPEDGIMKIAYGNPCEYEYIDYKV
ncbi:hypothetical protein N752_09345 [Desulforamulus aquiferis]|nr:carcinine hydrolase/isopenicillin-N N-acyltransferase family protein [Desulforamulus aquiferis]RYD05540.1 hypothetical protein N752_09345 [Desulforamulus aquiferis]